MRTVLVALLSLAVLCAGRAQVSAQDRLDPEEKQREQQLAALRKLGANLSIRSVGLSLGSLHVNFQGTRFSDRTLFAAKGPLLKLQEDYPLGLNICQCPLTDAGLQHVRPLTGLRWLDVSNTRVTNNGLKALAGLNKLEHLDLSRTRITDAGLKYLMELKSLKTIVLYGSKVSKKGKQELEDALPGVKIE